jgi:hypothetical protein
VGTPPIEPLPKPTDSSNVWDTLSLLNRKIISRSLLTPASSAEHQQEAASGAPPAALALSAEIDNAKKEFAVFVSAVAQLQAALERGAMVTDDQIGSALDKARAWVEYFGPEGPLCRGFPPSVPPQVFVDARARVGQLQRSAQQCVDYLTPMWEKRSLSQQRLAREEEECLQRIAQAEQLVKQRQVSFALNSSSLSSGQMESYIQELNNLLAATSTWSATGACAQRKQALVQQISSVLSTFRYSQHNRGSFEQFQRQQGTLPSFGGAAATGRPGPGSPEWFSGIMGWNCYWCQRDLRGLPHPVAICPNCGRFPQPCS